MLAVSAFANIAAWRSEIESWPVDVLADYGRLIELLAEYGPSLRLPYSRVFGDGLFELRPRGRSGIGRAVYCFMVARKRLKELQGG